LQAQLRPSRFNRIHYDPRARIVPLIECAHARNLRKRLTK
jgi:hypothetical protein